MAALQYLAPEFIKEGRLCWLRSPLYIVKNGKNNSYYYTDSEFDKVRKTINGTVTRAKGLGELSDSIARESMFDEANQRMEVIDWSSDGVALLCNLMGKEVAPRADFIFKNVDFSTITE